MSCGASSKSGAEILEELTVAQLITFFIFIKLEGIHNSINIAVLRHMTPV
jgi:hypothetical protein